MCMTNSRLVEKMSRQPNPSPGSDSQTNKKNCMYERLIKMLVQTIPGP